MPELPSGPEWWLPWNVLFLGAGLLTTVLFTLALACGDRSNRPARLFLGGVWVVQLAVVVTQAFMFGWNLSQLGRLKGW